MINLDGMRDRTVGGQWNVENLLRDRVARRLDDRRARNHRRHPESTRFPDRRSGRPPPGGGSHRSGAATALLRRTRAPVTENGGICCVPLSSAPASGSRSLTALTTSWRTSAPSGTRTTSRSRISSSRRSASPLSRARRSTATRSVALDRFGSLFANASRPWKRPLDASKNSNSQEQPRNGRP